MTSISAVNNVSRTSTNRKSSVLSQGISNLDETLSIHFISQDSRLLEVLDVVKQVANTDATVLITGESGTGKELVAQALYQKSSRCHAPFIAVNCGAISETLQESELFGHVKGAFTGATARKIGKFEAANGGTIFLDEISEMSKPFQVKLLRILQSGEYAPVGVAENSYCDVRVVAATNQDLRPLIEAGIFRKDLYYRLNLLHLELPPLRERKGDIPLLIEHFLHIFGSAYSKPGLRLNLEAEEILRQYDYPGNVRELENFIRRAVILCRDECISSRYLPPEVLRDRRTFPVNESINFHKAKSCVIAEFERAYLASILGECGGIVSRAAHCIGLSERMFHEKLKKYGIDSKNFDAARNGQLFKAS